MQRSKSHPENQSIAVGPLALHIESDVDRDILRAFIFWMFRMPIEHLPPMASPDLLKVVAGGLLRRGIERGNSPVLIGRKHPAADTVNDIFVEYAQTAQSLFLFTKREIGLSELVGERPAEEPDDPKCQAVDTECMERFSGAESSVR